MTSEFQFPDELVDPVQKEKPEYGVQFAKAILNYFESYGGQLFANAGWRHRALRQLAQGELDIESLKKLLGHFPGDEAGEGEGRDSLAYIDIQILKIIPKYINQVVNRLNAAQYATTLTPLDPLSVSAQEEYQAKVEVYKELKDWMETIGVQAKEMFSDLDLDLLNEEPDDLLVEARMNPQVRRAMEGEIAIKIALEMNRWIQHKRDTEADLVKVGNGVIQTWRDKNGVPRLKRIDPGTFICSRPTSEACLDLDFAGHIEYISTSQFRREASNYLTSAEIEAIIATTSASVPSWRWGAPELPNDNRPYLAVLRFQFLSENRSTYVVRKNTKGNKKVDKKKYGYRPTQRDLVDFQLGLKHGGRDLIENTYTSKYGGTYIIGTETVYEYGLQSTSRKNAQNLVDEKLDYVAFLPNLDLNKVVTMTELILEPVMTINLAWNKAKEILARGWNGVREVDFSELEKVALGKGGESWSPRQVFEFLEQKQTLISRSKTNRYDQSKGSAITLHNGYVTLADYFTAITMGLNQVAVITGMTDQIDGQLPPERLAVGVMNAAVANTNMSLAHYFHAATSIHDRVAECMLGHMQAAMREKRSIGYFVRSLGTRSTEYMKVSPEIAFSSYGLFTERQPDQEEWARFYAMIQNSLSLGPDAGGISAADAAFIYQIDNFKQAQQVLTIREEKRRRQAQQREKEKTDYLIQEQDAAAQRAAASQKEVLQLEYDLDIKKDAFLHTNAMELQRLKNQGGVQVAQVNHDRDVQKTVQQGSDKLVQTAMQSKSAREQAELKAEADRKKEKSKSLKK